MAERWFERLYIGMRFRTSEAVVIRLMHSVMVRTRSTHSQEREVSKAMLDKLVGVLWDPSEWSVLLSTEKMKMDNMLLRK